MESEGKLVERRKGRELDRITAAAANLSGLPRGKTRPNQIVD